MGLPGMGRNNTEILELCSRMTAVVQCEVEVRVEAGRMAFMEPER